MVATRPVAAGRLARQFESGSSHPIVETGVLHRAISSLAVLVVVACLPVYLLGDFSLSSTGSVSVPFWLILVWSGVRIVTSSSLGLEALHRTVFWLYVYVWLALSPLLQLATGQRPLAIQLSPSNYEAAGIIVVIGILAYELANAFSNPQPRRPPSFKTDAKHLRWLVVGGLLASLCVVAYLGPATFLESRETLSDSLYSASDLDNSFGASVSAIAAVPCFAALIALLVKRYDNTYHWDRADSVLVALSIAENALINNPIAQSRFWFTTVWGTIVILLLWKRSRLWFHLLPAVLLIGAIFVFPFSDVFRYSDPDAQRLEISSPAKVLATKGDFDSLEQIAWGKKTADVEGMTLGRQTLGAAAFWIPRRYWADKPVDTGIVLAERAGLENTSLSAPLWVEAYGEGGYILVFLAFLGVGWSHKRIDVLMSACTPSVLTLIVFYQLVILRGSLIASMATSASLAVVLFAFTRMRSRAT